MVSREHAFAAIVDYWYDASDVMIRGLCEDSTTLYVHSGHGQLCEKIVLTYTDYIYSNGRMVAKLTGSDFHYYIKDVLGSTC